MAIQSFRCHDNFFHLCLDKGDIIDSIEAEQIINDAYRRADIVLDSEDFYGETLFSATEVEDEKYNELKELGFHVITESEEE